MSGQQQTVFAYAANSGVLGTAWSSQSYLRSLTQLAPVAIEKDKSRKMFLLSNEGLRTPGIWGCDANIITLHS